MEWQPFQQTAWENLLNYGINPTPTGPYYITIHFFHELGKKNLSKFAWNNVLYITRTLPPYAPAETLPLHARLVTTVATPTLVSHSSLLTPQKLLMVTGSKPSNKIFQQASHNLHVAIESWSQRHYCQRPVCCSSRLYSTGHDPWTLVLLSSLGQLHIQVHHESLPTTLHIYGQRRVCAR